MKVEQNLDLDSTRSIFSEIIKKLFRSDMVRTLDVPAFPSTPSSRYLRRLHRAEVFHDSTSTTSLSLRSPLHRHRPGESVGAGCDIYHGWREPREAMD